MIYLGVDAFSAKFPMESHPKLIFYLEVDAVSEKFPMESHSKMILSGGWRIFGETPDGVPSQNDFIWGLTHIRDKSRWNSTPKWFYLGVEAFSRISKMESHPKIILSEGLTHFRGTSRWNFIWGSTNFIWGSTNFEGNSRGSPTPKWFYLGVDVFSGTFPMESHPQMILFWGLTPCQGNSRRSPNP